MKKTICADRKDRFTLPSSRRLTRSIRAASGICRRDLLVILLTGVASPCFAQNQWTGTVDDDWFTSGNWSDNTVPTDVQSIQVDGGAVVVSGGDAHSGQASIRPAGSVTVTGPGSAWTAQSLSLQEGTLALLAGGEVQSGLVFLNSGSVQLSDADTLMTTTDDFVVGRHAADVAITIENGARLATYRSFVGEGGATVQSTSLAARVSGADSIWDAGNFFSLGGSTTMVATLDVDDGGLLNVNGTVMLGRGGLGTATVTGAQSEIRLNGASLVVGAFFNGAIGHGSLTVEDGALVSAGELWVAGSNAGTTGVFHLNGTDGARGVVAIGSLAKGAGDASVLFDGGILRATMDNEDFIINFDDDDLVIDAGGLIIDTQGYTVTAASVLSGAGALDKTGGGTLIFTSENVYTGGTTIADGRLQLGDGGTTGMITGDVVNDAALSFNRSDSITFAGEISGSGAVHQDGAGTAVLTGVNSYEGGTFINAGTLQVATDANLGDAAGDVTFDGGRLHTTATFSAARTVVLNGDGIIETDTATALTLDGVLSGAGALTKSGAGLLVLTGDSTHGGGTIISAGALQVGDGGITGSLAGDVVNDAELIFSRSDEIGFDGEISGSGSVSQVGSGVLVLSADNSYIGGTNILGGTLSVSLDSNLGDAAGGVSIDGGTLQATDSFSSTRDLSFIGDGAIQTNDGVTLDLDGVLSGNGALSKSGAGTLALTGDSSAYLGDARVLLGTLVVDGSLGSRVDVAAGGRLEGVGRVGNIQNSGVVAPGGTGFGMLTVTGDYVGNGATLEIETVLGGDASPTDMLVVQGATSGATGIALINRDGLGAPTVEGIKIIDVAGASNGTFTLNGDYVFDGDQAVVGGAYAYRLYKHGIADPADGNWYLRSSLTDPDGTAPTTPTAPVTPMQPLYQPGVPVYEGYVQTLLSLNTLPTLQQRVGNRSWSAVSSDSGSGIWGRITGNRHRPQAEFSSSASDKRIDTWQMQMGLEHAMVERDDGAKLVGAITAHYGKADGRIASVFGDGAIDTVGYGVGATLSWYGAQGFYVDGQAQRGWLSSDLRSGTLGDLVNNNDAKSHALSIELGKRKSIGGNLSLTPQLQASYAQVSFNRFIDPVGARVAADEADSLRTRLGVSLDRQTSSQDRSSHVYGIINFIHEWLPDTSVRVSGTQIVNHERTWWTELGLGGSYRWNGRVTLYAEGSAQTALSEFGDEYSLQGMVGLRAAF